MSFPQFLSVNSNEILDLHDEEVLSSIVDDVLSDFLAGYPDIVLPTNYTPTLIPRINRPTTVNSILFSLNPITSDSVVNLSSSVNFYSMGVQNTAISTTVDILPSTVIVVISPNSIQRTTRKNISLTNSNINVLTNATINRYTIKRVDPATTLVTFTSPSIQLAPRIHRNITNISLVVSGHSPTTSPRRNVTTNTNYGILSANILKGVHLTAKLMAAYPMTISGQTVTRSSRRIISTSSTVIDAINDDITIIGRIDRSVTDNNILLTPNIVVTTTHIPRSVLSNEYDITVQPISHTSRRAFSEITGSISIGTPAIERTAYISRSLSNSSIIFYGIAPVVRKATRLVTVPSASVNVSATSITHVANTTVIISVNSITPIVPTITRYSIIQRSLISSGVTLTSHTIATRSTKRLVVSHNTLVSSISSVSLYPQTQTSVFHSTINITSNGVTVRRSIVIPVACASLLTENNGVIRHVTGTLSNLRSSITIQAPTITVYTTVNISTSELAEYHITGPMANGHWNYPHHIDSNRLTIFTPSTTLERIRKISMQPWIIPVVSSVLRLHSTIPADAIENSEQWIVGPNVNQYVFVVSPRAAEWVVSAPTDQTWYVEYTPTTWVVFPITEFETK